MTKEFTPPDKKIAWHTLERDQALAHLSTVASTGLASEDVALRLATYGPNSLPESRRRGPWLRFFLQFHNPLIYVLLAAGVVTFGLKDYVDAGVIAAVVLINALIGFIQEGKAEKVLDAAQTPLLVAAAAIITHLDKPLLVGLSITSVLMGLLTYGLISLIWRWRTLAKRRSRMCNNNV